MQEEKKAACSREVAGLEEAPLQHEAIDGESWLMDQEQLQGKGGSWRNLCKAGASTGRWEVGNPYLLSSH